MSKPDYSGTFHMVDQENMDPYLAALGESLFMHHTLLFIDQDAFFFFFLEIAYFKSTLCVCSSLCCYEIIYEGNPQRVS